MNPTGIHRGSPDAPAKTLSDEARRRDEIANFLRCCRNRLTPKDVGLPTAPRRRTPGLRREEVAQLAHVGLTWYTWLEQARPINVSAQVISSIAQALRLEKQERAHLFTLTGLADPLRYENSSQVPVPVRTVVNALNPFPAYVLSARWDILIRNEADVILMGARSHLPPERENVLWLLFGEPSWRKLLVDWERDAAAVLAQYRAAMASHVGESAWQSLVDELSRDFPDFRRLWAQYHVAGPLTRMKRFQHPEVGLLNMVSSSFLLPEQPGARMVVYTPCDDRTEEALYQLRNNATTQQRAECE